MKLIKQVFKYLGIIYAMILSVIVFGDCIMLYGYLLILNIFLQVLMVVLLFGGVFSIEKKHGRYFFSLYSFFFFIQVLMFFGDNEIDHFCLVSSGGVVTLYLSFLIAKKDNHLVDDSIFNERP